MRSIVHIFEKINPAWGVGAALVAHAILVYGIAADLKWHKIYPLREFYFIDPHIIVYAGITVLLAGLAFLRLKGNRVSLWVFVVYPLLSVFDEVWHRTFGIELATSPLAFWSPAHWSFSVVTWYVLFVVYRLRIETIPIINLLLEATLFFILPVRLLMYLAIPLAPYTHIAYLDTSLSHSISILIILFMCSLHYCIQRNDILLISVLSLATVSGPFTILFMDPSDVLSHSTAVRVLMIAVFIALVSLRRSRVLYVVLAVATTFPAVAVITGNPPALSSVLFLGLSSALFGSIYYDTERILLSIVSPQLRGRLQSWLSTTNG